jgi:hypothetical protein
VNGKAGARQRAKRIVSAFAARWYSVFGYRGTALILVGAGVIAYGTGLVLGYHPTFRAAFGVGTRYMGWIWIGVGIASLFGATRKKDALFFALVNFAMTGWALLLATHWTAPYGWAAAVSWAIPDAIVLVGSSWPEGLKRS